MNTSFLKNFITVAEEQSISAAARKAHIAQSALSLQLKALEDDTGCTLLVRSRKGVCLTDRGELLPIRQKNTRAGNRNEGSPL